MLSSESAAEAPKLENKSKKEGMDPVTRDLILGRVTVGITAFDKTPTEIILIQFFDNDVLHHKTVYV